MEAVTLREIGKRTILILNADRMLIVINGHAFLPLVRDYTSTTFEFVRFTDLHCKMCNVCLRNQPTRQAP